MTVHTQLCFLLFGTCLVSFLLLLECRKLEGYAFPVFSTKECPGNQADWKNRSSAINCTESNGYMCLPNENFTDLLEFCYIYPRILVQKDLCLYLVKRFSRVNSYNCRKFTHGCPELSYFSSETYVHPSCMEIENGCFSAEPSCKRQPLQSKNSIDDTTLAIILGVSIPACLLCILVFYVIRKKFSTCKKRSSLKSHAGIDLENLLMELENRDNVEYKEKPTQEAIFQQWRKDNRYFVKTKAWKEVENKTKNQNLIIVTGHSGSGKSAIIQNIALEYKRSGWTVIPVNEFEEIVNVLNRKRLNNKLLFVFSDSIGKESFDEISHNSWLRHREWLSFHLKNAKLLISCRTCTHFDKRDIGFLNEKSNIVDIDYGQLKLSADEKNQMLASYPSNFKLSDEKRACIVEIEKHFPLLCKLYFGSDKLQQFESKDFFNDPIAVLTDKILHYRKAKTKIYCALMLLILFNGNLCFHFLLENEISRNKFRRALELCNMPNNTDPNNVECSLKSVEGFLVKKIGNTYQFYHDFIMDVFTVMLETYHPEFIIIYADLGFIRRKVKIENFPEKKDPFAIYLNDRYADLLGKRLFSDISGECFLEVFRNNFLRNETVRKTFIKEIENMPDKVKILLEKKNHNVEKQIHDRTSTAFCFCKLSFICLENKVSNLFAMIVFCHTELSLYCFDNLHQMQSDIEGIKSLFPAVCCNGSLDLYNVFLKNRETLNLTETWGNFYPVHIASVFHNHKLLSEMIKIGVDVNSKTLDEESWTTLMLAVGSNILDSENFDHAQSSEIRQIETLQLLLNNRADINLCGKDGTSPIFIASQIGHDKILQLLLSNKANINLCNNNRVSPLYVACENGHDSTVQLLLSNGADIKLRGEDGASPLLISSANGHDKIVQLLLDNKAVVNLCATNGVSPLYVACENKRESIVQLLLKNKADINLCRNDKASPLFISSEKGYHEIVQLLLKNGSDINFCTTNEVSPFYVACQNGHESIVRLLLSHGANINFCKKNGASPLYVACKNGKKEVVKFLLQNGAEVDLNKNGETSPLHIACQNDMDDSAKLLLEKGAKCNFLKKNGDSPLHIACEHGRLETVKLLLSYKADINLQNNNGESPLQIAYKHKQNEIVNFVLKYCKDII